MLNVEKIRLMARISIYEESHGKDIMEISRHFKGDYVSRKILIAMIHYTLCFLLVAFIILIMNLETILLHLNLDFLSSVSKSMLLIYGIGGAICLIGSYIFYAETYEACHRDSLFYAAKLDKLLHLDENANEALEIDAEEAEYYAEQGGDIHVYNPERGSWDWVQPQLQLRLHSGNDITSPKRPVIQKNVQRDTVSKTRLRPTSGRSFTERNDWLDEPVVPKPDPSDWIDTPIEPEGGWLDDAPVHRSHSKHTYHKPAENNRRDIDVLDITKRK